MKKAILLAMLTMPVWAAGLPIKLDDYESPSNPFSTVYVYTFWIWIPLLLKPDRNILNNLPLCAVFALLDLFHLLLCFAIAWMAYSLYSRYRNDSKLP